jgi:pyrimidine operon attenuation protein / uracil phosphoribosyltransferase
MQLDAENLINVLAHELTEHHPISPDTAIIGIHTGGAWVAERLHKLLGGKHALGTLAVTLHRDDFSSIGLHHQKKSTEIDFAVEGRPILLVDDVIYTGRSLRAALNELFDFGRPASVKLACLVDRGGREMPFHADAIGMKMTLPADQELELIRDATTGALRFDIHARL